MKKLFIFICLLFFLEGCVSLDVKPVDFTEKAEQAEAKAWQNFTSTDGDTSASGDTLLIRDIDDPSYTGGEVFQLTLAELEHYMEFQQPRTDPDVNVQGALGRDTDDHSLRGYDSVLTEQYVYGQKVKTIQFAISDPENLPTHAGRSNRSVPVFFNATGFTFVITEVRAISDTDNYDFDLYISFSSTDISTANDSQVESSSFTCSTNGTSGYYVDQTSGFEDSTIENGKWLIYTDKDSSAAESVTIVVIGYLDGDVD